MNLVGMKKCNLDFRFSLRFRGGGGLRRDYSTNSVSINTTIIPALNSHDTSTHSPANSKQASSSPANSSSAPIPAADSDQDSDDTPTQSRSVLGRDSFRAQKD